MRRLENSRLGRAWMYVREDELAAEAMGIDTVRVKAIAFVLGSAWAGLAGVLYASRIDRHLARPGALPGIGASSSRIVVLGGIGSIPGVFVGTLGMVVLPEVFRFVKDWRDGFVGLAMVLMMIFRPAGLWPSRRVAMEMEEAPALTPEATRGVMRGAYCVVRVCATGVRTRDAEYGYASRNTSIITGLNTMALLEVTSLTRSFGGLMAVVERRPPHRARRDPGHDRAERRRQDDGVQPDHRHLPAGQGPVVFDGKSLVGCARTPSPQPASRAPSRPSGCSRTDRAGERHVRPALPEPCRCGRAILRLPRSARRSRTSGAQAERHLRFMNVWQYRNELAKNLPYGDQRRVEIARALATDPELLILDEPAAGLNEQESAELMALIRQIRDTGVTVFLIEHDMKVVMGVSDRVAGAGQRAEDRRRHAGRGAGQPAGDRGLPGARRGRRRMLR